MATLTRVERQEIAGTILYQLGGQGRLKAMINARQFLFDQEGSLEMQSDRLYSIQYSSKGE